MKNNTICRPVVNTLIHGGMSIVLASAMAASVQAEETHQGPNFTARLNLGVLAAGNRDYDMWAARADVGFNGLMSLDDGIKLKYEFVADFAGELNGTDANNETWTSGDSDKGADVYVHTARIFMITDYGMLLVAPRTISGQWGQLYANVDKFEYNRFHAQTGAIKIFGQVEQADDVVAYISPELAPGLRFVGAILTINDYNEQSADAVAWRFVYKQGAFNAGLGNVWVSGKQLNPTNVPDSYNRRALTAGYDFGQFNLGATYEINDFGDNTAANYDSYAVVAETRLTDKITATVGYANKDAENDAADNSGMIAKLKLQAGKNSYYYLEGGQYEEAVDNVLAGINIGF